MKSKRVTNSSGAVVSTIELDPWGGHTNRNDNAAFQPQTFNGYLRDQNAADDAMFRRYNRWWSRFDQPDPYDGSADLSDPQSFNRYVYVKNDPVNFVDPLGLEECGREDVCVIVGPLRPTSGVTGTFGGGDTGIITDTPSGGEVSPVPLPSDLEDRVANRVNNPATDCAEFIKRLITEVARLQRVDSYSTDPMAIFKRIQDEKGFRLKRMKPSGTANVSGGKRIVYIKEVYEEPGNQRKIDHIQNAYANTALNEIVHHAAGGKHFYSDRALARALFNILSKAEQEANPLPTTSGHLENSQYFHSFLTGRCPAP